ncbi:MULTISPECIES: amidase [unclassified Beijerinckia]|uniref:amidase n=1 Tax=unclassified Beijerinckia TaxID=2638183 RepID=UPI000898CDB6|nr:MULTISPECIES: amidase [unclassified Beijerinckia]MDH7797574.1 aspartyl-tRNA(Asn)/glutamyl-tRNA(Gln) amidotransferase subunit A [Beijerinckia sp. GAS462]SEC91002.1 aspartyl-tRNA(Asn)/glutamyl-tRNA(Gln) amidotransferase subunit A [Beijerinckia sp. 28-YEA-48]
MSELHHLTIAEAAALIAQRKLSPVELTSAFLDRIERLDPTLNAYLLVLRDEALSAARQAEAEIAAGRYKGPLHGIPIALKDIYATKGIRTTGHSALLKDYVPQEDAFTASALAQAGAILLGKTATWEFAIGGTSFDLPWPPARNPWNIAHDPGGSSSGSAAAVASGLAMAAMGTDTGGSIRGPAALCGIAGIKPTYGLVSRRGIFPLSFSLDHSGPMCWTAEDCALMLDVLAGHDPLDGASANVAKPDFSSIALPVRGLKIGFAKGMTEEAGVDPDVRAALDDALNVFADLGAEISEVALASSLEYADVGTTISRSEGYAIHEHALTHTPEKFGQSFRQRIVPGAFIRASDYVNAMRDRSRLIGQIADVMKTVDLIVTPSWASAAHVLGKGAPMSRTRASFMRPFNVTGSPALSVCNGFSGAGLPLAMQIVGRPFEDHLVLRAGHAFEKATHWRHRRPQDPVQISQAAQ